MLEPIWQIFTDDIAIDLGTANTLVALRGVGVVINEPSIVAINKNNNQVLAVGEEARQMMGRTPLNIAAVRPLRDGVISDFNSAESMLRSLVGRVTAAYLKPYKLPKPRVVVGVPSLITEVESMAVIDAIRAAGARKVYLVEEPIAAALGAGIDLAAAKGSMIIDIGGGTTDIVLMALGGKVIDTTIKIAGDEMNEAVQQFVKHKYNLAIGEGQAEEIKIQLGTLAPGKSEKKMAVSGRDLLSGLPKTINLNQVEIAESLLPVVQQIAEAAKLALEKTPPEIIADLMKNSIYLAGGGAQLPGLAAYLTDRLHIPVRMAAKPTEAVVMGALQLLDQIKLLEQLKVNDAAYI